MCPTGGTNGEPLLAVTAAAWYFHSYLGVKGQVGWCTSRPLYLPAATTCNTSVLEVQKKRHLIHPPEVQDKRLFVFAGSNRYHPRIPGRFGGYQSLKTTLPKSFNVFVLAITKTPGVQ